MSVNLLSGRVRRTVPWSTRLVVLFGGGAATFGWFFFAFGMIFVWIFGAQGDYSSLFLLRGKLQTEPAMVTEVRDSGFSEGGGKHRKGTPIIACDYEFTSAGKKYAGTSYRRGRGVKEGDRATAEFSPGRPGFSRLRGMRRAPLGPFVAFVFIFPTVGLGMALPGLWRGVRNLRLLCDGQIAAGRLIEKKATDVLVNERIVYRLTFEFTDAGGMTRQTVVRTPFPERLSDEGTEQLFYNPRRPAHATLLDDLPGEQAMNERGEFRRSGTGAALRVLIGPALALLVVALGAWVKFS